MISNDANKVFDYRALRLMMGFIAFLLPILTSLIASAPLSSISASYHTAARDVFVGLLFFISAFLWAYKGHDVESARVSDATMSKVAAGAAILVALFPTACDTCKGDAASMVHYLGAGVLFGVLAYFCFGPFRRTTKGMPGMKGRRARFYYSCGVIITACIVAIVAVKFVMPEERIIALRLTYWVEFVALWAFGFAWMVASKYKYFTIFVDEEDDVLIRLFG